MKTRYLPPLLLGWLTLLFGGCTSDKNDVGGEAAEGGASGSAGAGGNAGAGGSGGSGAPDRYLLGSVVIDAEGTRTTYAQVLESLDSGPFANDNAIELPGNGVILSQGSDFFVGLTEEPTWVKYSVGSSGKIEEVGRLSFLNFGVSSLDYGNAIIDAQTAVSVLSQALVAVVWNPSTMEIKGEVDLGHLAEDGYELEVWTTVAHAGRVYIPGRWSDWDGGRILNRVSTTILDPKKLKVLGVAEDERCASGGRIVFDADGYGYVMGDGRNYSSHMFANAAGEKATDNCLLRIAPRETSFDADYFFMIPTLTDGRQSITELETGEQGSGVAFAKMFYPDKLPAGVEPVDFTFWGEPAHKLWRLELADPPTAKEVRGVPFSTIGFSGSALGGYLYSGESPDGATTEVFEIDISANRGAPRFSMTGYFYGLYALAK